MDICNIYMKECNNRNSIYILIKKYILEFDVLNAPENEARELLAWLQLELKLNKMEQK